MGYHLEGNSTLLLAISSVVDSLDSFKTKSGRQLWGRKTILLFRITTITGITASLICDDCPKWEHCGFQKNPLKNGWQLDF
jgi:hypothetical protein